AATTYVYYSGSPPVGAGFAHRDGLPVPTGTTVCPALGSPFGASYVWADVTIDSRLLPAGTTVVRQVGVAVVMLPSVDLPFGVAGGYVIGRPVGSGHGVGAAVSMIWTSAFGTLSADMFRGEAAIILVGDSQL
ncbi:MAG TPA: hypothetical protein VGR28_00300, partial [Candidatus Thermoplasmatota archaeon]|nr:hypothetical protein [Candidatus Thermoplasmatota archaeon]